MNRITIDLETRSDRDITKCGVYAYADSPYFDILLFSYSIDGDKVQVVDIANGEKIPDDILKALTYEKIIKCAFNVNFERVCLSRYLAKNYPAFFQSYSVGEDTVGDYLNPKSWHCTMIHMSNPSHNDRMELEIFDSFSKTVMRNTGRNIASASKIIKTNETVSTDTVQYILKTQGEREIYPSEHIINDGKGHSCVITTEWLYQAMLLLTDKQKEVIILEFW